MVGWVDLEHTVYIEDEVTGDETPLTVLVEAKFLYSPRGRYDPGGLYIDIESVQDISEARDLSPKEYAFFEEELLEALASEVRRRL